MDRDLLSKYMDKEVTDAIDRYDLPDEFKRVPKDRLIQALASRAVLTVRMLESRAISAAIEDYAAAIRVARKHRKQ